MTLQHKKIIEELNNNHIVKINNFLPNETFLNLKNKVEHIIKLKGNKYFRISDKDLDEYNLRKIFEIDSLDELTNKILINNKIKIIGERKDTHTVLRVLSGNNNKKGAGEYHFDSFLITFMLPIILPDKKLETGKFMLIPNLRKIQKYFILSLLQKIVFQNFFTRYILSLDIIKKTLNTKEILLEENTLYIFYGYKSYHGSSGLQNNLTRVTFLNHIYKPHNRNFLNKLIFNRRNKKEKQRSKSDK